jgi:hypothetical protein
MGVTGMERVEFGDDGDRFHRASCMFKNSQNNSIFDLRRRDMVRKDCFGYDARCEVRKKARCTALNNLYCENENSKFYKTRDEYERQERRKDGSHE